MHIHNEFADRLLSRLEYIRITPKRILVIGLTTHHLAIYLQKSYPLAVITEAPFASSEKQEAHDLIIAQFPFLGAETPQAILQRLFQHLRNNGLLLFTALGPDSYQESSEKLSFIDMHHIGDWMKQVGFSDPVMDREEIMLMYDTMNALQRDAVALGVTIAEDNSWPKTDNFFSVTIELISGHGWKLETNDEICISVERIQRRGEGA